MRSFVITILAAVARAQYYRLSGVDVPKNGSLRTLQAFYLYAFDEAPERPFGRPYVEFQTIVGKSTSGSQPPKGYESVQLSLVRVEDLNQMRANSRFCCFESDHQQGTCKGKDQINLSTAVDTKPEDALSSTVRFEDKSTSTVKRFLRTSGVYILVISNCGQWAGASTDGMVMVKHAYGYLPGNEYHKMPFFGWLSLFSVGVAILWVVVMLQWRNEITKVQKLISGLIFLCVCESLVWQSYYSNWNKTGVHSYVMFGTASFLSVLKWTMSFAASLLISLGWSVTRPYLDRPTNLKVQVVCFLYAVFGMIQSCQPLLLDSHTLPPIVLSLVMMPATMISAGITYWIVSSVGTLLEVLQERQQQEKLVLFQRFWMLLVVGIFATLLLVICELFDIASSIYNTRQSWKYEWLYSDTLSNAGFLLMLVVTMRLWAPGKGSQDLVFSRGAQSTDPKKASAVDDVFAEGLDEDPLG